MPRPWSPPSTLPSEPGSDSRPSRRFELGSPCGRSRSRTNRAHSPGSRRSWGRGASTSRTSRSSTPRRADEARSTSPSPPIRPDRRPTCCRAPATIRSGWRERPMDVVIRPGGRLEGVAAVPGDKSIAHRWLILSVTAKGSSRLVGLPPSLDVRSTAACLSRVSPKARAALDVFARDARSPVEGGGSTWNAGVEVPAAGPLEVEGDGRDGLIQSAGTLECGNSGTSMRLLCGVLAAAPFTSTLTGDPSLSVRPMERVAAPLRTMGASVETTDGHAPVVVRGGALQGGSFAPEVPSAQVKSAILFAGVAADGTTSVRELAVTRDHTERALEALGAPVERDDTEVRVQRYQHG